MDRIEKKFQQLKEIGISGLILFFKGLSNFNLVCQGWNAKETWTSCFTGGEYFQHEFGIPYDEISTFTDVIDSVDDIRPTISKWRGLYHFEMWADENHMFTIYVNDKHITLANTYGGVRGIAIKKFHKELWIDLLVSAMSGSVDDYAKVFDIPRDKLAITKVDFKYFDYKHQANPKFLLFDTNGVDLRESFSYVWDPIYEFTDEQLLGLQFTPGEIKDIRAEQAKHVLTCRYSN